MSGFVTGLCLIDLSNQVFSTRMAYVAQSRVWSLSAVYLAAFDPKSIMFSVACLKEVHRLRHVQERPPTVRTTI